MAEDDKISVCVLPVGRNDCAGINGIDIGATGSLDIHSIVICGAVSDISVRVKIGSYVLIFFFSRPECVRCTGTERDSEIYDEQCGCGNSSGCFFNAFSYIKPLIAVFGIRCRHTNIYYIIFSK